VLDAEVLPLRDFEQAPFFEGCLPIEELARRGEDTMRFGPMKPVGLTPPDGSRPYAVVQLRPGESGEDPVQPGRIPVALKWPDQRRVLRTIPGSSAPSSCARARSPQHLHKRAGPPRCVLPIEALAARSAGGTDHRGRGISGVGRHRPRGALYILLERRGGDIQPLPRRPHWGRSRAISPSPTLAASSRLTSTTVSSRRCRAAPRAAIAARPTPRAPSRPRGVGSRARDRSTDRGHEPAPGSGG
jgi:hypothetical protein